MRQQQKRKLNASLNNLVAILDEYFPEYQEVFKTLAGKASQHVLRHTPFPEDILKFTVEELAQELKGDTKNRVRITLKGGSASANQVFDVAIPVR
jgi:transposase